MFRVYVDKALYRHWMTQKALDYLAVLKDLGVQEVIVVEKIVKVGNTKTKQGKQQ